MVLSGRLADFQRHFIVEAARQGIRTDGRELAAGREVYFNFSLAGRGQVEVRIGDTRALCFVSGEVVKPQPHRPTEGLVNFNVDLSIVASKSNEVFPSANSETSKRAAQLAVIVESVLRKSKALDTEALCVEGGAKVWALSVDIRVLDDAGNVVDVVALAALAGLQHFRRDRAIEKCFHISKAERLTPAPLRYGAFKRHASFSIHHTPVLVTLSILDGKELFVIDASKEEEAIATGQISVAVNQYNELCGIHKLGGTPMDHSILHHALNVAVGRASIILERLNDALRSHNEMRENRRLNIWRKYGEEEPLHIDGTTKLTGKETEQKKEDSIKKVSEYYDNPTCLSKLITSDKLLKNESVEILRTRLKKRQRRLMREEAKKLAKKMLIGEEEEEEQGEGEMQISEMVQEKKEDGNAETISYSRVEEEAGDSKNTEVIKNMIVSSWRSGEMDEEIEGDFEAAIIKPKIKKTKKK